MTTYVYQSATFSNIPTAAEKKKIRVILGRLEKEGLIEKTGRIAGEYRILKKDCEAVDSINASTVTVIALPVKFGETYSPKNIPKTSPEGVCHSDCIINPE